jgi:hypothetical protein
LGTKSQEKLFETNKAKQKINFFKSEKSDDLFKPTIATTKKSKIKKFFHIDDDDDTKIENKNSFNIQLNNSQAEESDFKFSLDLNRSLFKKRIHSKSLDQIASTQNETRIFTNQTSNQNSKETFRNKLKNIKNKKKLKQRYCIDPRFNSVSSDFVYSSNSFHINNKQKLSSPDCSTTTPAKQQQQQLEQEAAKTSSSLSFLSRIQWPRKYYSNKKAKTSTELADLNENITKAKKNSFFRIAALVSDLFHNNRSATKNNSNQQISACVSECDNSKTTQNTDHLSSSDSFLIFELEANKKSNHQAEVETKSVDLSKKNKYKQLKRNLDSGSSSACGSCLSKKQPSLDPSDDLSVNSCSAFANKEVYFKNKFIRASVEDRHRSPVFSDQASDPPVLNIVHDEMVNLAQQKSISCIDRSQTDNLSSKSKKFFAASSLISPRLLFKHSSSAKSKAMSYSSIPPSHKPPPPEIDLPELPFSSSMLSKSVRLEESSRMLRVSNEYSEPFDLLVWNGKNSQEPTSVSNSPTKIAKSDDDSAYSSSYINQSTTSTLKLNEKRSEYCDTEEDTALFDSSMLLSSSSTSSSPLSALMPSSTIFLTKSPRFELISHSGEARTRLNKPLMQVFSEYESVRDMIVKQTESSVQNR